MRLIIAEEALLLMDVEITKELRRLREGNQVDEAYRVFLEAHREMFTKIIESCPTVDKVKRAKGRWLFFAKTVYRPEHYTCSVCGANICTGRPENPAECPHCHSEMEV